MIVFKNISIVTSDLEPVTDTLDDDEIEHINYTKKKNCNSKNNICFIKQVKN